MQNIYMVVLRPKRQHAGHLNSVVGIFTGASVTEVRKRCAFLPDFEPGRGGQYLKTVNVILVKPGEAYYI